MIMITCPNTGRPIPTGIGADKDSFESAQLSNNAVGCPACGETHVWNKKDAYLDEE